MAKQLKPILTSLGILQPPRIILKVVSMSSSSFDWTSLPIISNFSYSKLIMQIMSGQLPVPYRAHLRDFGDLDIMMQMKVRQIWQDFGAA